MLDNDKDKDNKLNQYHFLDEPTVEVEQPADDDSA